MKPGEIIRIIGCILLGFIIMILLQPLIYQNRMIRVSDVPLSSFNADYIAGAWVVLAASILATVLWCLMAATAKVKGAIDTFRWSVIWWLLGLLPIVGLGIALFFFNRSEDATLSLAVLFFLDGLILLYWLPTVTSTPGLLKYVPPLSFYIRRIIG